MSRPAAPPAPSAPAASPPGAVVAWLVTSLTAALRASEERFRALSDSSPGGIFQADLHGHVTHANAGALALWQASEAEALGLGWLARVHPDDRPQLMAEWQAARAEARACEHAYRIVRPDGTVRHVQGRHAPVRDAAGVPIGVVGTLADVTEQREAEARVGRSERHFRALIEHCSDMVTILDADGVVRYASPSHERHIGYAPDELHGRSPVAAVHRDDLSAFHATLATLLERPGGTVELQYRHRHRDRSWRTLAVAAANLLHDPDVRGVVLNARDVTDQARAAEERARLVAERDAERARLGAIIEQMPAAVVIAEAPTGEVALGNAHVHRIFGHGIHEAGVAGGYRAGAAAHADGRPVADGEWPLARAVRTGERIYGEEYRYRRAGGSEAWVRVSAGPVRDRAGEIVAGVLIAEDVSERKALEAQLAHEAFHDALTGLANRALFRDRVGAALARAARTTSRPVVLFLDLDDFKGVNDSLGHAEGDRLLVQVAARLLNATRGCDTVARLGGDEFAVLIDQVHGEGEAIVVARRILDALARPVVVATTEFVVRASVGIAQAEAGDDADALLRNADVAMYHAKRQGKGRYAVFAPAMYESLRERMALEHDLRHAVAGGQLHVAYQPVVDLVSGRVTGVEALARWAHPTRGPVAPGVFIGIAEESGLILGIGRWLLAEACRQVEAWRRDGAAELYVSVNISGRQLQDAALVDDVRTILATSGLAPHALVLEITESVVMGDADGSLRRLHALKALGVRVAIDDFGTGYSSLSYLQRLPVDVLKIDKSFVNGVADGAHDTALTRTIIALGETLGLATVAEGIETEAQRAELVALGCGLGQGYLFAAPTGPDALPALLGPGSATGAPGDLVRGDGR